MTGVMRAVRERLRGARGLEWLLLLVAACVAALALTQSGADTQEAGPTPLEARLERVLSAVDGAGDVRAMVTEREEEIVGVVIVAEGADDVGVRLALLQAARAALNIDMENIEVIGMRREAHAGTVVVSCDIAGACYALVRAHAAPFAVAERAERDGRAA